MYIQYIGTSDTRHLGVEDVGADLVFHRHVPTEVEGGVAETILEHPGLVGEFEHTDAPVAPDAHDDSIDRGDALPGL